MGIGVISIMGGLYWLGKKIFEGMAKGLEAALIIGLIYLG